MSRMTFRIAWSQPKLSKLGCWRGVGGSLQAGKAISRPAVQQREQYRRTQTESIGFGPQCEATLPHSGEKDVICDWENRCVQVEQTDSRKECCAKITKPLDLACGIPEP